MRDGARRTCVTRRRRCAWSALCGADLDDLLGEGEIEPGIEVDLRLGGVGALAGGPGRAGEGDRMQPVEVARTWCQVWPVRVSMMRIRSSASQQSTTWARMRS